MPLGSSHSNWNWAVAANGDSKNAFGAIWTRSWGLSSSRYHKEWDMDTFVYTWAETKIQRMATYRITFFLGRYYLPNVRNSECIHKILQFETYNITDLYNKDCSTMYYKITIATMRISDLQQCCHYLSNALAESIQNYNINDTKHSFIFNVNNEAVGRFNIW